MITGPLFKWFGSKWLSSKSIPAPKYNVLIEPFAGSAGYSLRNYRRDVILAESDTLVAELWWWLIHLANESIIREIPIDLPVGIDIRTIGLERGQQLLLKHWQRTNNVGDCWTVSPWGNKPGQWTANTRARVAEQHTLIRHWKIDHRGDGLKLLQHPGWQECTLFIDPPYQYNYQYKSTALDYGELGGLIQKLPGQRIVCEALEPKTNREPTWLPFMPFASRVTSRRKATEHHHSNELIHLSFNH